jgi:hypothetical protein
MKHVVSEIKYFVLETLYFVLNNEETLAVNAAVPCLIAAKRLGMVISAYESLLPSVDAPFLPVPAYLDA